MSKILVVILAVNMDDRPGYVDTARKPIEKYYKHFGVRYDFAFGNHPDCAKTSPSMMRLLIHDLYPEEDFILVQGLDMLPCNLRHNVFDFIEIERVNMAVDYCQFGVYPKPGSFEHFKYNADMLGFPKQYAPFMREVFTEALTNPRWKETFEQYALNKMLWERQIFVNEIPIMFNTFYHPGFDYLSRVFCHYTNFMPSREKLKYINDFHPKEMFI